ncbi:glutamine--fructose-6-phosphate transaminase (isomerizing) [candidate division WOR-3 bacterium]|nr:glutamine--fructose-6-phosphate transaminase (isomerizing) [candidate division WOR-3 bacterium]
MCGIIGYVGGRDVPSVLLGGLWRLEYRGYDSSGIAVISNSELVVRKVPGKLSELEELIKRKHVSGTIGIGHTRWATHGLPQENNTHPLVDCNEEIALVVNGIIENYLALKDELEAKGHIFRSLTDSEVIVHLIEENRSRGLAEAVKLAVKKLTGNFAFAVISINDRNKLVCARHDAPLICCYNSKEAAVASDISGVISIFDEVIYIPNDSIVVLQKGKCIITNFQGRTIKAPVHQVTIDVQDIDKGRFPHFMLKEIYEQPKVLHSIVSERIAGDGIRLGSELGISDAELKKVSRIVIQACGTSWHAGLIGKYIIEKFARIHTEVDISSEFRYRDAVFDSDTLVMAISQSGETADTIAGLREAKVKFLKALSLVNVLQSSIHRESDGIIEIMAGPEIGVASTKAYTAEIVNLHFLALYLGLLRGFVSRADLAEHLAALEELPGQVEQVIKLDSEIREIAKIFCNSRDFLFLGRGLNYATALEGALKLKEISYINATGYAAGEMKHGPIAMIDNKMPIVCVNPRTSVYEKMLNNIQEAVARKGIPISIVTRGDRRTRGISAYSVSIPECHECVSPVLSVIPLQLLAYHIATLKGLDVDRPRNLAKSVTVE